MDEESRSAIAESLGNPQRDFAKEPLTQEEIQAVVQTYSDEMRRADLHPDLREIYRKCVEILKKYLIFH